MANLEFKVIGINNIIDDTNEKFVCSVSDGKSIYIGSERTDTTGNIWKYTKGSWSKITSNLADYQFPLKSITSLLLKKGTLFASTGGSFEDFGLGQLWYNNNGRWISTGVASNNFSTIRKIVKIQDDIYAAGSVIDVKKYSNGSWSSQLFPQDPVYGLISDLVNHFWLDLETDGTNLFAIPFSQLKTPIRGIWQYDGATWTEISDEQLSDSDNKAIIKLCWYSGKLYAATYNEETGTQIHKRTAGVWSQINTNGFGTRNNYSTACMKVVAGNLVVTTENNEGSEVWIYNEVDDWEQHTVNSEVLYLSYLVESTDIDNFLIGTTPIRLISNDPAVQYISPQERAFRDVHFWPEGSMGAIPIGLDKYRFLAANNKRTLISEGPATDPLEYIHSNNELHTNELLVSAYPSPAGVVSNLATTSITFEDDVYPGAWVDSFNFNVSETPVSAHYPNLEFVYPIEYLLAPPAGLLTLLGYTKYFNALHVGVIPKGINRGKLFVMNSQVVLAKSSLFNPSSTPWSFQSWAIVDPSPDAGTPEKPRFLNYLLPICSGEYVTVSSLGDDAQLRTKSYYAAPNLFCAGHSWDHDGNLIVAGGTRWAFDASNFSSIVIGGIGGFYHGDRRTYLWNPASLNASWKSGSLSGGPQSDLFHYCPEDHYASAGSWVRGPDLKEDRWYPTVTYHPKISRTSDFPHALIFGGSDEYSFAANNRPYVPQYNNYESLVISGGVTVSNCGYYPDSSAGTFVFNGPAPDPETVYEVSGSYLDGTSGIKDSKVPRGSFYFYPRTYLLSGGGITFAGMTDESSLLKDHSAEPGVWYHTLGGTRTGDSVTYNEYFQQYNSSVRLPNTSGNTDRFLRLGGENVFLGVTYSQQYGIDNTARAVGLLDASVSTNQWSAVAQMISKRSNFNTVLLPDATIFCVGGFETLEAPLIPRFTYGASGATNITVEEFINRNNPAAFYDHHHADEAFTFGEFDDVVTSFEHHVEHFEELYDIDPPQESGDPTNLPVGGIQFHAFPEVLNEDLSEWTEYTWAPHQSWRDYHSASVLLPDGRVMLSGGENRHSMSNGRLIQSSGIGFDFEIFAPKYIRPTQDEQDRYPRPTGVGISGANFNSSQDVNCFELEYNHEYILSSNFIRSDVALQKVVFMAPGIVTHHADVTQRYYACSSVVVSDTQLRFRLPTNIFELPPGFYMVFAVTDQKVPAEAIWIKLLKP